MGLDSCLYGTRYFVNRPSRDAAGELIVKAEVYELFCWRSHWNFHGYIVNTFAAGTDMEQEITLDQEQLEQLIGVVTANQLPLSADRRAFPRERTESETAQDVTALRGTRVLRVEEDGVMRTVYYRASW
jgi:hypothetical protein